MNQKIKGILCIISAAFCFACMSAFVRAAGDLPSIQKAFFRNAVALVFAFTIVRKNHTSLRVENVYRMPLFFRALFGTLGVLCNFYAVDHLLLADASMLNKLAPFFAILMSMVILHETIRPYQALSVVLAFIGALLIIKPGIVGAPLIPSLIGVLGAFGAGAAYTLVRLLGTKGLKGPVIVFYFSAFSCIVLLPNLILHYVPMSPYQLAMLLMAGLAAAGGQFSVTAAYTYAPAAEISVYDYSQILFSTLLGILFFGQIPDRFSILGYIIIIGTSIAMFLKQRQQTRG